MVSRKRITSRDNPVYKELKQYATNSQARRRSGKSLLDGVHLCEGWLTHIGKPRLCVVGETAISNPEVAEILRQCEAVGAPCAELPDALYAPLSQVEHGVGLLFLIDTPTAALPDRIDHTTVLLDNLQDPGNLGSILRSAAAAGVQTVVCGGGTVFAWSPKVLRAGMGAHFVLRIVEQVDLAAVIDQIETPILATSSHAAKSLYESDLRRPVSWLFGHEGQGVSPQLLQRATATVAIPHAGAIESLNVAASAAVCLFEQLRQSRLG